jgi:hypothetical protein
MAVAVYVTGELSAHRNLHAWLHCWGGVIRAGLSSMGLWQCCSDWQKHEKATEARGVNIFQSKLAGPQ